MMTQSEKNALDRYLTKAPEENDLPTITINDVEYEYSIETNTIVLHVDGNQVLALEDGYKDLHREAEQAVGHYRPDTGRDEDGETFEFEQHEVDHYVDTHIEEFIQKNFSKFVMIDE